MTGNASEQADRLNLAILSDWHSSLVNFLNPLMLFGLAGVLLPLLVHLLSRKRYDVVEWGAMQFLELKRTTRRKMRLEQLLLMLLRMGLIALIALAMARPWVKGGWFAALGSSSNRDVVLVVDGSYSMGWEGAAITPQTAAIGWAHRFLEELQPGDRVALIDARSHPQLVIESPTHDFAFVRKELNRLPAPAGSLNLAPAVAEAARLLNQSDNVSREIVVITDGQARGWHAGDEQHWTRFDVLREESAMRPNLWVVNVATPQGVESANFHVQRLQLSREVTVARFPVRIRTRIGYSGGDQPIGRSIFLEVDGQRLGDQTIQIKLEPEREIDVEFEHRFVTAGSHVVSVVLEEDNLPADNRADAVVTVADAIPLLLIDGAPHPDPTRNETFFASAALSAKANETPWVHASIRTSDQLDAQSLNAVQVALLANVRQLTTAQVTALEEFVAAGGGLIVALGDQIDAVNYNQLLYDKQRPLLPVGLETVASGKGSSAGGTQVDNNSLAAPWMIPFRAENDGGLTAARFLHWWKTSPAESTGESGSDSAADSGNKNDQENHSSSFVAARFANGDPFLLTGRFGRGRVLLVTSALDADWSNLPAKPDYVSLLHEMVFHLAAGRTERNIEVGRPLVLPIAADGSNQHHAFFGPGGAIFAGARTGDALQPIAQLTDTWLPGTYRFARKPDAPDQQTEPRPEFFVVNDDRRESDRRPLNENERAILSADDRMVFIDQDEEFKESMLTNQARSEYWQMLMILFLGMLVGEVALTRHLVKGGHAALDDEIVDPAAVEL